MTRRIVIAILLTMGMMLLLSDGITYMAIRSVLLEDLDQTILQRVALLPQVVATAGAAVGAAPDARDRYVIESDRGQTLGRPMASPEGKDLRPRMIAGSFSWLAGGGRYRTLTIRALARPASGTGDPVPATIVYSGSAEHFDTLLGRLMASLALANVLVATATTLVARWASFSALRPLSSTAATIGGIDERHLDRRIAVEELPSELRAMAERLNEMLARLEESVQRRRRFLGDASHELRAPVAALMTGLEVCLRRPREAEEYRRVLQDCLGNTRMLRTLVETLMAQVKSENFDKQPALEPVETVELLASCLSVAQGLAGSREIEVTMAVEPMGRVLTAPARLRSIVINLLSNAVEYNRPGGRVELRAKYAADQLQIMVSDTGQGIPKDELPHVLEPFYRVDKSRSPSAEAHLGLGLFLVESHVEGLGGQLSIESTFGEGTRVMVRLPAPSAGPSAAEEVASAMSVAAGNA